MLLSQTKSNNIQTIDGKKYYIHKIEKGQSLYSISKTYSVTLEEIYRLNPDLKITGAKVDQEIKVPLVASAPVTTSPITKTLSSYPQTAIDTTKYLVHKVAKSETIYSITKKYNINEKQLATFNPGLTPVLHEGQLLVVGEKFKKKSSVKESKEPKQAVATKTTQPLIDSSIYKPISKPRKTIYNVGLILPFRFEQTLSIDLNELLKTNSSFPNIPALAIDLYLGVKRAADSLSAAGFSVNLELFESDDKDSLKLAQITNDPRFKDLDLIFGPLYASGFKSISKEAKALHIPIVSPITTQNKILFDNVYISKTNPSQFTLLECLADFCIDSLAKNNSNIILVTLSDKDKKEAGFVSAFKKYYNERQKKLGKLPKDTVTTVTGITGVKTAYKPNVKNVIITLSSNQVFLADFTTQLALYADRKDILLCGWQSLTETDNIDQEYLNQFNFTFPYPFNITNLGAYTTIAKPYFEKMQTIPGEYFYLGYDMAWYYLKNLKDFGPEFIHRLQDLPMETNYMRFKYARPDALTGFDNRGVYIFRYSNYQLQKTGWK
ncbi:MAG: LysM peptidoglycan-binding domain-containing protein [Bacteroidia bacterium]|nr:LysM peptidoglycan-binding domain-containing protein [Bacteroidia bacterium]